MRTPHDRVAAARACLGARFRPHGRSIAYGLDCAGVAALAFDRPAPATYALRGGDPAKAMRTIDAAGLVRCAAPQPGDLLLIDAGAGQLHLAVLVPGGFVHADARLRRVVETPGSPAGTILAAWTEAG